MARMKARCDLAPYLDALRKVPLFAALTGDELDPLLESAKVCELEAGARLFEHRQPAQHYYFLLSGEIKLLRSSAEGHEKVIEIIRAHSLFAEAVVFMAENPTYPVSAQAISASELVAFDHKSLLALLGGSPTACFRLMAQLSKRLHAMVEEIDRLTLHNGRFRFTLFLLEQIPKDALEGSEIVLTTPKNVVASKLGVTPETFSRIEAQLVAGGQIKIDGRHIVIRDLEGLRRMVSL